MSTPNGKKFIVRDAPLHPAQGEIWKTLNVPDPPKTTVIAAGARFGKDRFCLTAMLSLAYRLLAEEEAARKKAKLVPLVLCWYIAPTFRLLRQSWDELKSFARTRKHIKLNKSEMRAFIYGGKIQIEFQSADDPDSLLARGVDIAVITEAARIDAHTYEHNISSRLISTGRGRRGKGGLSILNSTPKGKNWFYDLYVTAAAGAPGMQAFHFTSFDNPLSNHEEIMRQKRIISDFAFRQEYLAEFISPEGLVFPDVEKALKYYDFPVLYDEESSEDYLADYHIGIDWGRTNDRSAICVFKHELIDGKKRSTLVYFDVLENMQLTQQAEIIAGICERFPTAEVISEKNNFGFAGNELLEPLIVNSITEYNTGKESKPLLIDRTVAAFERHEIILPAADETAATPNDDIKILFDELRIYEATKKKDTVIYSAPAGKHDDAVIALCLAVSGKLTHGASTLHGVRG